MSFLLSNDTRIGAAVSAIAVGAMAVDHLMGDDPGLEDVPTFLISSGLSLTLAVVVFRFLVPRGLADPARAATRGMVASLVSVLLLPTIWLGLPFPVAGGGIALGLVGWRDGRRRRRATLAVALGTAVVLVGTAAYAAEAVGKSW